VRRRPDRFGLPDGILYKHVTVSDVPEILNALDVQPVERLLIDTTTPFFTRQHKVTLSRSGHINPEKIEDYIGTEGYVGEIRAITSLTSQGCDRYYQNQRSARPRGGGFPTATKWQAVHNAPGAQKYVICNADEGDPGAFMDRSILESDPHSVIEGMAIAAYAVGASQGYIYVRAEYPLAVKRLRLAIRQAERAGLLGKNIAGVNFNFNIEIRLGAGAFVCGEETALISSIEGNPGNPRPRPPYPAQAGLGWQTDPDQNVETYANVPHILRRGGEWFASIGTANSKRHQGLRIERQDRPHRPDRSADGNYFARNYLRYRRRHPGWPCLQGSANRRPIRRLHSRKPAGYAGGIRNPDAARFDHGLGRHHCH
jgi:bidirectional [NiFe] hydrogenase diaphorase subunit